MPGRVYLTFSLSRLSAPQNIAHTQPGSPKCWGNCAQTCQSSCWGEQSPVTPQPHLERAEPCDPHSPIPAPLPSLLCCSPPSASPCAGMATELSETLTPLFLYPPPEQQLHSSPSSRTWLKPRGEVGEEHPQVLLARSMALVSLQALVMALLYTARDVFKIKRISLLSSLNLPSWSTETRGAGICVSTQDQAEKQRF